MKKYASAFLLCLLTTLCCFSQSVPHLQVIEGDTGAWVPIGNIRAANALFIAGDCLREQLDSCRAGIASYSALTFNLQMSIQNLTAQTAAQEKVIDQQKIVIAGKETLLGLEKRRIRWLAVLSGVLLAGLILKP